MLAGVAELADAPDLGSGGNPVQVQVLSPAPKLEEYPKGVARDFCFMQKIPFRQMQNGIFYHRFFT